MSKTILKSTLFFPVQDDSQQEPLQQDSLHRLVRDMKHALLNAEQDLLSPRPEAVQQLLKRVSN